MVPVLDLACFCFLQMVSTIRLRTCNQKFHYGTDTSLAIGRSIVALQALSVTLRIFSQFNGAKIKQTL